MNKRNNIALSDEDQEEPEPPEILIPIFLQVSNYIQDLTGFVEEQQNMTLLSKPQ